MNGSLAQLAIPGVEVSDNALHILDPQLPFEQYEHLFEVAGRIGDAARWWIGDLILFGDARYGEGPASQVLGHARVSERQASRYRWVCERVVGSRRRENLSFSHHEEVAPLEPRAQRRLLTQAEKRGWTVRELREHVKAEREIPDKPKQERLRTVEGTATAAGALVQQKDALHLAYRHLRGDEGVDALAVAEAIPPALEALEQASVIVAQAEQRLASVSLLEAAAAVIDKATRSSGFAMVPEDVFGTFVSAVNAEKGAT